MSESDEHDASLHLPEVAVGVRLETTTTTQQAGRAPPATNGGDLLLSTPRSDEEEDDEPPRTRRTSTTPPTTAVSPANDATLDTTENDVISGDEEQSRNLGTSLDVPPSLEAAASSSLAGESLWREIQLVQNKLRDAERNFPASTSDERVAPHSSSTTSFNPEVTQVEPQHPPLGSGGNSVAATLATSSSEFLEGEQLWCEIQRVQRKLRDVERNLDECANASSARPSTDEPTQSSSADYDDDTSAPTSGQNNALTAEPPIVDVGSSSDVPSSDLPPVVANNLGSTSAPPLLRRDRNRRPTVEPGAYRVRPQGRIRVRPRRGTRRIDGSDDEVDSDDDVEHYAVGDEGRPSVPDGFTEHSQRDDDATDSAGLVRAEPINEEDVKPPIMAQATPFRRKLRRLAAIFLTVILIVVGIVVAIVLTTTNNNNNNNGGGAAGPTSAPTSAIPLNMSFLFGQFLDELPAETLAALEDANSSQSQAYQWMNESIQLNSTLFQQDTLESAVSRMTQRFALATLYFAASGSGWSNRDNWLDANVNECGWAGCVCTPGTGITGLLLPGNGLDGTVPLEIFLLSSSLNVLNLEENILKGTLPTQLGLMSSLQTFQGGAIQLQGSIPASLGSMSALTWLDLSQNQLKGPIPPTLGQLSSLSQLTLSDNSLTGEVPSELGLATNLARFQISGNDELRGTIPSEICALDSLEALTVDCSTMSCDCCGC